MSDFTTRTDAHARAVRWATLDAIEAGALTLDERAHLATAVRAIATPMPASVGTAPLDAARESVEALLAAFAARHENR